MKPNLKGLLAAPFTPMNDDGTIHLEVIEHMARNMMTHGVTGAFVNGTTGESMSLTVIERLKLAERWLIESDGAFPVIVNVGHLSLTDARTMADHAQKYKAYGIATTAPCYFKAQKLDDLVDFCAQIAEAAPETPFYYYHIPCMTDVNYRVCDFFAKAKDKIPTLRGAKFSHEDLVDLGECIRMDGGRFEMLYGKDEMMLSALPLGTQAFIGSTFNFAAPTYLKLIEAFNQGDMKTALKEQARSVDLVNVMNRYGGAVAGKSIMKLIGIDCGPSRLPQRTLSAEQREAMSKELEETILAPQGAGV